MPLKCARPGCLLSGGIKSEIGALCLYHAEELRQRKKLDASVRRTGWICVALVTVGFWATLLWVVL